MSLRFSRSGLLASLEALSPLSRTVFAAACSERLCTAAKPYLSEVERLLMSDALRGIWETLENKESLPDDGSEVLAQIEATLELRGDGDETAEGAIAQDTLMALSFLVECLRTGGAPAAEAAAECIVDVVTREAVEAFQSDALTAEMRDRLDEHPILQAELVRQDRDIKDLVGVPSATLIRRIRQRAHAEGATIAFS